MEAKKESKALYGVLAILIVFAGLINFVAIKAINGESITLDEVQEVIASEIAKIPAPVVETTPVSTATETPVTAVNTDGYTLTKREFENQAVETKALELATESVNSKDFKKAVFAKLNNTDNETEFEYDIESYKDITSVVIKDSEYSKSNKNVKFEVVVYFFSDGDEENTMKAYLTDFTVGFEEELDFDELEDAEAKEVYTGLELSKVKEI